MKHLPKHLRPRWRYLAVELEGWPDLSLSRGAFQRALWYAAQNLLGDAGSADAGCTVVRFAVADGAGYAVVRARRGEVGPARAAVACVDDVDGEPIRTAVVGVSGTIRACEEKYIHEPTEVEAETTATFAGEDQPAVRRGDRVDVRTERGHVAATTRETD